MWFISLPSTTGCGIRIQQFKKPREAPHVSNKIMNEPMDDFASLPFYVPPGARVASLPRPRPASPMYDPSRSKYTSAVPVASLPRSMPGAPMYQGPTASPQNRTSVVPPSILRSFPEPSQAEVWAKGSQIPGSNPAEWRRDICGSVMKYSDYGNRRSGFGWESDHIFPESLGGSHALPNRQPLHWKNNAAKGDTFPWHP